MTKNPQAVLDVLEFYSENFGATKPEPKQQLYRAETETYAENTRMKENYGSRINSMRPSQSAMSMKVIIRLMVEHGPKFTCIRSS